jgi:hypothetical protein
MNNINGDDIQGPNVATPSNESFYLLAGALAVIGVLVFKGLR